MQRALVTYTESTVTRVVVEIPDGVDVEVVEATVHQLRADGTLGGIVSIKEATVSVERLYTGIGETDHVLTGQTL